MNWPKLGKIVYADRSRLYKLNLIVWPAIYKLVETRIEAKYEVIVYESDPQVKSNID